MSKTNWRERHGPDRELNERDLEILAYFTARQNLGEPAKRIGSERQAMAVIKRDSDGKAILEFGSKVSKTVLLRQYNAARRRLINKIDAQPMFMGRPLPMPLSYRLDEIPRRGRPKKARA